MIADHLLDSLGNGEKGHRDQQVPPRNHGRWRSRLSILVRPLPSPRILHPPNVFHPFRETYLGMRCRMHELRNKERISVAAASKILANIVYEYKGQGLSMGTMICGWDKTGPAIFYVDNDGTRLKGDVFAVGSGATFAYGVLDQGYHWDLSDEDAQELGRRAIVAAGHRDAYSGNTNNLFHVREDGWEFLGNKDVSELWYKYEEEKRQARAEGAPAAAAAPTSEIQPVPMEE